MGRKPRETPEPIAAPADTDLASLVPSAFEDAPGRLGYIPDREDARDWNASALFGAPAALPSEALELEGFVAKIIDQVGSSCVGQAIKAAICARLGFLGHSYAEPSGQGIYAGARGSKEGMLDLGCYPRDAMSFVKDMGVPSEAAWPMDPATINAALPWSALQDASRYLLFQWWRIYASGGSRSDAIAQALSQGIPVIFGMELDSAFFENRGELIRALGSEKRGGHMLCLVGYRTGTYGKREFLGVNSWGEGWGTFGKFWISEDVLADERCGDFYALQIAA